MLWDRVAMVVGLALGVVVIAAKWGFLPRWGGNSRVPQGAFRTSNLPALAEALSRGSKPERWAALMFGTPDRQSDDDTIALQISIENGSIGFDWVLLAPRNVEDREKFISFARAQGVEPIAKTLNGVSYLRVDGPDAAKFAASIVTELYRCPPDEPLDLVHEGFDWPPR